MSEVEERERRSELELGTLAVVRRSTNFPTVDECSKQYKMVGKPSRGKLLCSLNCQCFSSSSLPSAKAPSQSPETPLPAQSLIKRYSHILTSTRTNPTHNTSPTAPSHPLPTSYNPTPSFANASKKSASVFPPSSEGDSNKSRSSSSGSGGSRKGLSSEEGKGPRGRGRDGRRREEGVGVRG